MPSTPMTHRTLLDGAGGAPAVPAHAGAGGPGVPGGAGRTGEAAQPGEAAEPSDRRPRTPDGTAGEKLMLRIKGRLVLVDKASIDWVDAVGNYVRFNVAGQTYQVRATLHDVEQALPAGRFMRMHRSTIVNLDAVKEFVRVPYGDLVALLKNGKRLTVGRRYRGSLAAALETLPGLPAAR